ncbi:transcription elongation factor GreA [Bradyrhizobium sp. OAE829]|uniref:transcription elongation factor GreA n=1 Tax=Bradyrhizobium sp. OAE829 TaxID=2663807 RepID=UPI00178AAE0C
MNKLPMTSEGFAALKEELGQCHRERPYIAERIREAIADEPNLPENAAYQTAKSQQDLNEARIAELQDKLARAEVIDVSRLSGDTVKFGATVTLIDEETRKKRRWQIVGEPEADAKKGKISVFSPLGRALIGQTKNATVEVQTPTGFSTYRIDNVEWC